jgi:hypothetical protein
MGIKHSIEDLCFIRDRDGDVVNKIPVPDDTFHADAIEYVGVSKAVEEAGDAFTMFEFGAGWGPWMATSGIACQMRGGFKIINLTGVEGDINKISYIQNHLKKNNLMPQEAQLKGTISNINTAIYHGVVNTDGAPMKFPQVNSDNYAASLLEDTFLYNNLVEVPGYSPVFLFKEYDIVDLVHIDIQGYEGVLLSDVNMISTFKQKVKYICLGTHSRKIEGDLFEHLYNNGFYLLRETPCKVSLPLTKPKSFIDITKVDGTQIWRNLSIK